MAAAGAAAVLRKALKSTKTKVKGPPSAYILFSSSERQVRNANDAVFQAMAPTAQMKELGAKWKSLGDADKAKWQADAEKLKAAHEAEVAAAPEPVASGPYTLSLKDDAAIDKFAEEIAKQTMKIYMQELLAAADAGAEKHVVPGGTFSKFQPGEKGKNPPVAMSFQPVNSMRKE